ncbi:sigma-70 family RNA polymerase sigma factor [Vibrio sp. SS-MA-C1-2]|nr:sigma-70 family RNA polymerase sigma factor [Vibrio sp. SS-MA-C1-2]UJF16893.1 sigma-70 family RNA polymerase sigma factor [Vibrio sp. SS-MA-C1-2]
MDKQKRYETLVRAYHKDLYRYAFWLVKDKAVAEDLVQETCLRAWKALDSLTSEQSAKPWLITILRRENARRFERKQLELVDIDDHQQDIRTDDDSHHQNQWLQQQIMNLDEEYREPLLLQVLCGFSGDEISDILKLNKNTVMTRLFRARNQIKDNLNERAEIKESNNG